MNNYPLGKSRINFLRQNPVVFFWIMVNVFALLAIFGLYIILWHLHLWRGSPKPEDLRAFYVRASHDQLVELASEAFLAGEGAVDGVFLTLKVWLGITILNVVLGALYIFRTQRKRSPQ